MRFDDLDPIAPPPQEWRARLARVRASALSTARARSMLRSVTPVLAAAARVTLRGGRAQATRLSVVLRNISRDRRLVAVAAAALLVVTGISAGVVASRGSARTPTGSVRLEVAEVAGAAGPVVREAAPPAAAPAASPEDDASLSPGLIIASELPDPSPPSHRRRSSKHAKASPRHGAHAKAAGKPSARSAARPASGR
jgi:hypothetical protein